MPKRKKQLEKSGRGRKPHIQLENMDQFYELINKIQTEKEITYIRFTLASLAPMIENILKDAGLEFTNKVKNNVFIYRIIPTFSVPTIEELQTEMLEDEILEEGQLF